MDALSAPEPNLEDRYEANSGLHPWLSPGRKKGAMTGKELRALRLSLDLTQRKFAAVIGMSRWTVMTAERIGPSRFLEAAIYRAMGEGKLQPDSKPRDRRCWPKDG